MKLTFIIFQFVALFAMVNAQIPPTPFAKYDVDASECTVLHHEQTSIYIPQYSFLLKGKTYEGTAHVYYRQFMDALDILINNISMNYTTEHGTALLESAGMFEIYVLSNTGDTLEMNTSKHITVRMNNNCDKKGMESYYLADNQWRKNALFEGTPSSGTVVPSDDTKLWDDDIWNNNWNEDETNIVNRNFALTYEAITDRNFKTLNIDKFGMYNLDKIVEDESIPIYADFSIKSSKTKITTTIYVIYEDLNTIYYYHPDAKNPLLLLKNHPFTIVAFANEGTIAKVDDGFIQNIDFLQYKNKTLTFPMTKIAQKVSSKDELSQIIK